MINVTDVAYGRFNAPDLDKMEAFLLDFGLHRSARTDDALYMCGTDPDHHLHITHLADKSGFIGMAFKAASMEELKSLATAPGASAVEEIDEPGGGYRVRLTDPNGYRVEAVFGIGPHEPFPPDDSFGPDFGPGNPQTKAGTQTRARFVCAPVKRLGHVVLNVTDCNLNDKFYKSHFGFLSSDECFVEEGSDDLAVVFNRCNRRKEYVDHHTLLTVKSKVAGFAHLAFEVDDINALFSGHELLKSKGYQHSWGVGRHTQSGQIFDYWFDPYGHRLEHFKNGDLLNEDDGTNIRPLEGILVSQWGAQAADRRASLSTDYDPLVIPGDGS